MHEFKAFLSDDLNINLNLEISNFYRYIFNNANNRYLLFPETDEVISPKKYFELNNDRYVPLEKMDGIKKFPIHPLTGEQAIFWHDPFVTFNKIHEILNENAYISVAKNEQNELAGVTYAYIGELEEIFRNEWSHKHCYSRKQIQAYRFDFFDFLVPFSEYFNQNEGINVSPKTEFICWNCTALDISCRGLNVIKMLDNLFTLIHERNSSKPSFVIMEVEPGESVYDLCMYFKAKELPGILQKGAALLYFNFEQLRESIIDMRKRLGFSK